MGELPSGVVTFVFTDIENSTPMFERLGDAYRALQERHRAVLRAAFAEHAGIEMSTEGDSFFVVFADPAAAVRACVEGQRALAGEPWPTDAPIRVRMGIHAGQAAPVDGGYTALAVHAAARVMAAGNGGQIVASEIVRTLAGDVDDVVFVDAGPHRLRGLSEPVRLYLLGAAGLPADERPLRTSRVATTNLPVIDDPLVGRAEVLAELERLVRAQRCVTITGTGGVGKTRLALATAAAVADEFADGAWFVDLHALRVDEDVAAQVAQLLQASPDGDPVGAVARAIADGRVLLVLDNCEHLLSGASAVAETVTQRCPNATVLVTSREPLGLQREVTWRAPSLADRDAITLLETRISEARGGVVVTDSDREALGAIAQRLDGIPLALELAAARCGTMAPGDVARRLDERFRLLTGARGSLSRHQTLEAAVAWSVDLLDDKTRIVFRRLAAFAGGWTLDAAEEVAGTKELDALDVDDGLSALVDKSLVVADLHAQPARYSFLETVRQYAQGELIRAGEADFVYDRHLALLTELIESLDAQIPGPDESAAMRRISAEFDNLQAALDWADTRRDLQAAATIVARVSHAGTILGRGPQIVGWIDRCIAALDANPGAVGPELHADVLVGAARVSSVHLFNTDVALPRLRRAWALLETAPGADPVGRGMCAGWLSTYLGEAGDIEGAVHYRKLALELSADRPAVHAVAMAVFGQMLIEWNIDPGEGLRTTMQALDLAERAGTTRALIYALSTLAWVAAMEDDVARAEQLNRRIAELAVRLPPEAATEVLAHSARELVSIGSFDQAAETSRTAVDLATASGRSTAVLSAGFAAGEVAAAFGDMALAEREWTAVAELAARQSATFFAMLSRYRLRILYQQRGDIEAQRRVMAEARPYAFRLGWMPRLAWYLGHAHVELLAGDRPVAREAYRTALDLLNVSTPMERGAFMTYLAVASYASGLYEDTVRVTALGYAHSPPAQQRTATSVMMTRAREARDRALADMFSAERHAELCEEGRAWTLDDVSRLIDELTADGNS